MTARFLDQRLPLFARPIPARKRDPETSQIGAGEAMLSGQYDLVVLDEVNIAAAWGLVDIDKVVELIHNKPENVELILTGRYADSKLIELADLVTEMVEVKHPYSAGILSRRGFDH